MGSYFSEQPEFFKFELINTEESQIIRDIDDILFAIKSCKRKILERIEYLEKQISNSVEVDKEIAVLIRQNQYFNALEQKEKRELEEIFFPNGKANCIIPDVFLWYQEPES